MVVFIFMVMNGNKQGVSVFRRIYRLSKDDERQWMDIM